MTTVSTRRFQTFGCCILLILVLPGCMATESQQGDTFVYKKTMLNTLMLLGISVAFLAFGIFILRASLQGTKTRRKRRSAKRRRPMSVKQIGAAAGGAVLTIIGAFVLLFGVPGSRMQHITVSKDRVTMRLSVLQFSDKEILFSSITSLKKHKKVVASRRGPKTKETMFIGHTGGGENIEMGPLEMAAYPKLVEMLAAYREAQGKAEGRQ